MRQLSPDTAMRETPSTPSADTVRRVPSPPPPRVPWIVRFVGGVLGLITLVAIVMAIAGFGSYYTVVRYIRGHVVEVPNLTNETASDALEQLGELGLTLAFDEAMFHDTIAQGCIIRQTPRPGRRAKAGAPVWVVLSRGAQIAETPDVMGQPENEARRVLTQNGIEVGAVTRYPSATAPPGTVLRQTPMPNEGLRRDHPVHLLVSSGPPALP